MESMQPAPTSVTPATPGMPLEPEQPRRVTKPFLVVLIVALFLVGAALTLGILSIVNPKSSTVAVNPTPVIKLLGASLVLFEGDVEYQKGTDGWKTPSTDTVLSEGDKVRVLATGRAVISFDDGSVVRLHTNSVVRLVSLKPDRIEIANEKGEVYARVVKSQRTFLVTDGKVTYESLGTAYKTVNENGAKEVDVYHSKVKVIEDGKEVVVEEGNKYSPETEKTQKIALAELKKDTFATWNKLEDEKTSEFKDELGVLDDITVPTPTITKAPTPTKKKEPVVTNGKLSLSAQKSENGVKLHWDVENISAPQGFKIVKSESANPVYPGNSYQYVSSSGQRDLWWEIKDGKTYHFRVCVYTGDGCSTYSNDVESATPTSSSTASKKVSAITVKSEGGSNISWSLDGYSEKGFKVVWSKNADPTYPTRDGDTYHYYDSPDKRDDSLSAFSGSGKYYVRVCEYLGGACGVYSNQTEIDL